ncbi:MAG: GNAT family N-acetyltransferase [Bdellovibrionales bacterium]
MYSFWQSLSHRRVSANNKTTKENRNALLFPFTAEIISGRPRGHAWESMAAFDYSVLAADALEPLAGEWRALHARLGNRPFTSYEWVHTWWHSLGKSHSAQELHIVTARKDGQLAGLLPLATRNRGGLRILGTAGHEVFIGDVLCDSLGQAKALWHFARENIRFDIAQIKDMFPELMSYSALASFAELRDRTRAPYLTVAWSSGDEWFASLPGRLRNLFTRRIKRMKQQGPVSFEVCTSLPLPKNIIDDMIAHKISRLRATGEPGPFDYAATPEFIHKILTLAAQDNQLFLGWLKCGDRPVAYIFGFIYLDTLHFDQISYDPAWAHCSPGNIALNHMVRWAIDNGLKTVDFRQGDFGYKNHYAAASRDCGEFMFGNGSLKSWLARHSFVALRALLRLARSARAALRQSGINSGDGAAKNGAARD